MDLHRTLHGHVAAAAIEVLLVDAGYQVIPTGIERSLRELQTLGADRYLALAPPQLRTTPDFFVLDLEAENSWLVEVKSRRYLHENLCLDLKAAQRIWSPLALILVVEQPPPEWRGEVKHIRVFDITPETRLTPRFFREEGARLQDVFMRLKDKWSDATILTVQEACLRLVTQSDDQTSTSN
jgi:hypothetical protein